MKLYGHPISGNTHRVRSLLSILGVPFEEVVLDLAGRAHKTPEFLALNPLGQVPVLEHDGLVLRDSTAILVYLARAFDETDAWLPRDPAGNAQVQQWLSVAVHEVMTGPFVLRAIVLFGASSDRDQALAATQRLLGDLLEPHLSGNDWLATGAPTIADLACYSYVARVVEGGFSLTPYPAVRAWLSRVEALEGFVPMPTAAEVFGR